jgi:hypothetical protein
MNIFWKAYNNKHVLSVHALIVYKFLFLRVVDEKIEFKVLACSLSYYCNFENPFAVTRFKDPKAAILILKMLT